MSKGDQSGAMCGFYARGAEELARVYASDARYRAQIEAEKRRRIESLLLARVEEFRTLGYWSRQKLLRDIHVQVAREFSSYYCLF
jgi:hypothetical protein